MSKKTLTRSELSDSIANKLVGKSFLWFIDEELRMVVRVISLKYGKVDSDEVTDYRFRVAQVDSDNLKTEGYLELSQQQVYELLENCRTVYSDSDELVLQMTAKELYDRIKDEIPFNKFGKDRTIRHGKFISQMEAEGQTMYGDILDWLRDYYPDYRKIHSDTAKMLIGHYVVVNSLF